MTHRELMFGKPNYIPKVRKSEIILLNITLRIQLNIWKKALTILPKLMKSLEGITFAKALTRNPKKNHILLLFPKVASCQVDFSS